ncbi:alpha-L-fucosidase 2 [Microbacterium ginsengiterrae]|uniref:Alpha-L-fucosidase 2 n=1 Tax=Microbacterium ginsengiterrae TaxID=546115 RepID=A0A7W9FDK8_9MICO|nr:glycoside hydrolase N-terminal domain-containing protein [Microbacterium ginsengiterrae]MBB5743414.1 alpha-L-fucosidase 2 [Microbacterium ginsengiterrae]
MPMSTRGDDALHVLRYRRPSTVWTDALPVGNGHRAAMCEGRPAGERLHLNEGTAWSGPAPDEPRSDATAGAEALAAVRSAITAGDLDLADRLVRQQQTPWVQAFLPFGTLDVALLDHDEASASLLERSLDLRTGVAAHAYIVQGVGTVRHETWADAVTGAIVHRVLADKPVRLEVRVTGPFPVLDSAHVADAPLALVTHWHLPVDVPPGHAEPPADIRYDVDHGRRGAVVVAAGSAAEVADGTLRTAARREHLITIGTATADHDGDAVSSAAAVAMPSGAVHADGADAGALRTAHITAHRELYDRCALDLPVAAEVAALDTDERILRAQHDDDPGLVALSFHYGRYLLMSASRPGGLPANLQGIWNAELPGPWSSGYTTNINLEMAYWPAETTNLAECHEPLLEFVDRVSSGPGAVAARELYGTDGWVLHHNTDPWGFSGAVVGEPSWSTWPMGGVWLSLHLWEHWLFSGDREWLRDTAWPVLVRTARFALDWIQSDGERAWTSPSTSPEHRWLDAEGTPRAIGLMATMDAELLRELSAAYNEGARVLGLDEPWVTALADLTALLPPVAVDGRGRIAEWSADVEDAEPDHRHLSHLVGLFPLGLITPDATPDLAVAAGESILGRGPESTGWALAWRALMWARLRDGERVHAQLRMLLRSADQTGEGDGSAHRGGVYRNLFSAHPPFQIDGNLGFTAAVAEALVQSHGEVIELLPALPAAWPEGAVRGIRARGGVTVDVTWSAGRVAQVTLYSTRAQSVRLRGAGLDERIVELVPNRATTIETMTEDARPRAMKEHSW